MGGWVGVCVSWLEGQRPRRVGSEGFMHLMVISSHHRKGSGGASC